MRIRPGRRSGALIVVGLLASGLVACEAARASSIGRVSPFQKAGPTVTVSPGAGCPTTIGSARDVANDRAPTRRLLPSGIEPVAALVCWYDASTLARSVRLDTAAATRLDTAIGHISLAVPDGVFNCPAALASPRIVLAFVYGPGRTVDLWYDPTGCATLDNGDVSASEAGNSSFYSGFYDAFRATTHAGK